jgi:hypothetical protein
MPGLRRLLAASLLSSALTLGCGSDVNPIGPSNQPQITNATDSFQFQASNLVRVTQTLTYTWANTGTQANVDQSGVITDGTATLIVRDAAGNQVYNRSLRDTGSFTSTSGTSGSWQIEVRLTDVTGTVNFRVQKP